MSLLAAGVKQHVIVEQKQEVKQHEIDNKLSMEKHGGEGKEKKKLREKGKNVVGGQSDTYLQQAGLEKENPPHKNKQIVVVGTLLLLLLIIDKTPHTYYPNEVLYRFDAHYRVGHNIR